MSIEGGVVARRPEVLLQRIAHHARDLEPIVGALAVGILLELVPNGWTLRQHGTGPNSFSISKGEHQFHFRAAVPYKAVVVKDSYHDGQVVETLDSRVAAMRFVRSLRELDEEVPV